MIEGVGHSYACGRDARGEHPVVSQHPHFFPGENMEKIPIVGYLHQTEIPEIIRETIKGHRCGLRCAYWIATQATYPIEVHIFDSKYITPLIIGMN